LRRAIYLRLFLGFKPQHGKIYKKAQRKRYPHHPGNLEAVDNGCVGFDKFQDQVEESKPIKIEPKNLIRRY